MEEFTTQAEARLSQLLTRLIIGLAISGILFTVWGFIRQDADSSGLIAFIDYVADSMGVELLSIAFTVGVVDRIITTREKIENAMQKREEQGRRLVDQLRTSDDPVTMNRIVQELRDKQLLTDGSMESAFLRKAILTKAKLYGASLHGVIMTSCNLKLANLENAQMQSAQLSAANLESATLIGANLDGANLQEANLYGANLHRASLIDADLTDVKMNRDTRLPDGNRWTPSFNMENLSQRSYYGGEE